MKRRLTLIAAGVSFGTTLEHEDAEHLIERWRAAVCGDDDAQGVAQVNGMPVMHVALTRVVAIRDEID